MKRLFRKLKFVLGLRGFWFFRLFSRVPLPISAIIDASSVCNLACPLCPTGSGKNPAQRKIMKVETFTKILEEIPTLKQISLFNWGEPFLNPDIFQLIRLAKDRGIKVSIHSNFSFQKKDSFFSQLIQSGLDKLELSIDGADQQNYERYRKNGDFDLVLANLKKLVAVKKRLQSKNPKIIWKFIVHKKNEKHLPKAQKMAKDLGVEFQTATIGLGDNLPDVRWKESLEKRKKQWLPRNKENIRQEYFGKKKTKICPELFGSVSIGPDGSVFPCCYVFEEKNAFGNLNREKFLSIWKGEKYRSAREIFVKNKKTTDIRTICHRCRNYDI